MVQYNEKDTVWHLLVRTRGGEISVIKNLDAPTARQAYRKLVPDERPKKYINTPPGGWSFGWQVSSRREDVDTVDILGPEGAELDPWKGVEPLVIDVGKEIEVQRWMAGFDDSPLDNPRPK